MGIFPLAYAIDWGWLRIGPPYVYININPVMFSLGPLQVHWYGLMYVVGIIMGLWAIRRYTESKGIDGDTVYRILWWCIAAGLIGGRLYFVVQQPDLWQNYILQPINIIATWNGGMAFFGAIFLVIATLFWRARSERINPFVLVDAGVIFGTAGQIFGRIGNLINGDIVGEPSNLPWSTVYQHPGSYVGSLMNVPVQPASLYELLTNIAMLAILFFLARRLTRPGILGLVYLYLYSITQFLLFYARGGSNVIVQFLGLDWGLRQAQWTSLVLLVALIPITIWVLRSRFSRPVPAGEVAARYGIEQKEQPQDAKEQKPLAGDAAKADGEAVKQTEVGETKTNETAEPLAQANEAEEADKEEQKQEVPVEGKVEGPGEGVR